MDKRLKALAGALGAIAITAIGGFIANVASGTQWKGVWPFISGLPSQAWKFIVWRVPIPLVVLVAVLFLFWRTWNKAQTLEKREAAALARHREVVRMYTDNTPAKIRWRFLATRGTPNPIVSEMHRHCLECDAPLVVLDRGGRDAWMSNGAGRTLKCPFGHVESATHYTALEQEEEIARAAAIYSAAQHFHQIDSQSDQQPK